MLDMLERILHEQEDPWSVLHNLYGVFLLSDRYILMIQETLLFLSDTWEKFLFSGICMFLEFYFRSCHYACL